MPIEQEMKLIRKNRQGQVLIIVVIVFATIISIFAIALSSSIRYGALEGTEIYKREQALYLAEMGVNKMIYNINTGTTYYHGDTLSGDSLSEIERKKMGSYVATYKDKNPADTFGGSAYIKGEGTVGKDPDKYTRTIYVSLVGSGDLNTYKYCMFSGGGGEDGLSGTSYFTNNIYPGFFYNSTSSNIPTVNLDSFLQNGGYREIDIANTYSYTPVNGDKVYLKYVGGSTTLTINPANVSCSIITDFPNVILSLANATLSSIPSGVSDNFSYPLIVHIPQQGVSSSFKCSSSGNKNLVLNGLIYTNTTFSISYSGQDKFTLNGMLIAGQLGSIAPKGNATFKINYNTDFVTKPPLYFSIPGTVQVLIPSYREEY